jgi:antitoxin PrlF
MGKNQSPDLGCCGSEKSCCKVEAIITVDAKGQIVLPKDVRDKLEITPGEKLALVVISDGTKPCCATLMKASWLSEKASDFLGPLLRFK